MYGWEKIQKLINVWGTIIPDPRVEHFWIDRQHCGNSNVDDNHRT